MKPSTASLLLTVLLACRDASGGQEGAQPEPESEAPRPNVVVILADDLTYSDVGCYGGQARTPAIDALAAEGLRFTQCFTPSPMCSPTRHALYNGLYPVRSGAYPNHAKAREGTRSVVQALAPAGYRVALAGKSHVEPPESYPFESLNDGGLPGFEALGEFMAACRESRTPFCVFVCPREPHDPWTEGDASAYPPDELELPPYLLDTPATRDAYSRYLAEVTLFDQQVARTVALLDEHELADETLVVVLSEQGSSLPFGKWTLYDAGIRSACVVRWPGVVEPGRVTDALVDYVDFLPTLLDAAGLEPAWKLDGSSFLPVLRGERDTHDDVVFALQTTRGTHRGSDFFGIRAARSQRYKYIVNLTPDVEFENPIPRSPAFLSWQQAAAGGDERAQDFVRRYLRRPPVELYDLATDPHEWHNRADDPALAGVRAELDAALKTWMESQGDRGQATELEAREHMAR